MTEHEKIKKGKFLSLILRHEPAAIGLSLDESGWASVSELLTQLALHKRNLTMQELEEIVATNNKKRYSFNEDKTCIRANQGHSLEVDLGLEPQVPPNVLYHGTASRFVKDILQQGLQKRSRQHVHLSVDIATAKNVGSRHGVPVILEVAAQHMQQAGFEFYCSENGVWLADEVPVQYLKALDH